MELTDAFSNATSLIIFFSYIGLYVSQGILVTASHRNGEGYEFNIVIVVLITEGVKLLLSFLCYIKDNTLKSLWHGIRSNVKILAYYLVSSFLYCIYNNLAFINLSHFDPTSYSILLQVRVVFTGIIFQLVFSKKLTKMQWMSLKLLTCGCVIQQIDWAHFKAVFLTSEEPPSDHKFFSIYLLFILIQVLCSCFAGVFNEYLLKETGADVNLFIQNIFMCSNSIVWNFIVLTLQGNLLSTFSDNSFRIILQPLVIAIILNNSFGGITASLFLKNLNSILKTFATAIELVFIAVLSWIIFGIEIKLNTVVAILIIFYSLYIYSRNPVNSRGKGELEKTKDEGEVPLIQDA